MTLPFKNETQHGIYRGVISGLRALGYSGELLIEDYRFGDYFAPNVPERTIPAAAFGQTPVSYDSACFGVVVSNGDSHKDLVARHRALGAPIVFEVADNSLRQWVATRSESDIQQLDEVTPARIAELFADNARNWKPDHFLRAKNIGDFHWNRQLELFAGLLPDLEHEIQQKLDPMLRSALSAASEAYFSTTSRTPDPETLFRLIFWLLTGKVFRDRGIRRFGRIKEGDGPDAVLAAVAQHYKTDVPRLLTRRAREEAFDHIWLEMNFRNLSVDVLSHIWSTTLVTAELKKKLGIHRTPRTIAKYIVERIPFEAVGDGHRTIVEPCCGSGVFLVAAMNRLRSFQWGSSPQARHSYFKEHLVGFEKDPFGVEISKLALALADFPNPNGWEVAPDDVFDRESGFPSALQNAGVVLCNPPFEDFEEDERSRYAETSVKKPVELLNRVLDDLHPQGVLGFVLPRKILDGRGYRRVRRRLAERFASIEVTSLPDKAFEADHESALLIAAEPLPHQRVSITHRKVRDSTEDWKRFEWCHVVSSEDSLQRDVDDAESSFAVPELASAWKHLQHCETLGDIATIHRGIEWNKALTLEGKETGNRDLLVRSSPAKGFELGVPPLASPFHCYQLPPVAYLCLRPEDQRGKAHTRPWKQAKVILNSLSKSRGAWRISAFADTQGLTCYQTFTAVWPRRDIDLAVLAAILNGPVASAFVATREGIKHITIETLEGIPVPRLAKSQTAEIRRLVKEYLNAVEPAADDVFSSSVDAQQCEQLLKCIDAVVLAGYELPPRVERLLLDFFNGRARAVPFDFSDYFPSDFESCFSLSEYLSPDFQEATAGRLLQRMRNR